MAPKDRIDEIRAREQAATPGPWIVIDLPASTSVYAKEAVNGSANWVSIWGPVTQHRPNAEFIAQARFDVPYLLTQLDAAQARVRELEAEVLKGMLLPRKPRESIADWDRHNPNWREIMSETMEQALEQEKGG